MTPQQRRRAPWVGLAIVATAAIVFVSVTAMQGGSTINVPAPSASFLAGTLVTGLATEFGRRMLKKLDDIGVKCDTTSGEFEKFRVTVETVLLDVDGRGGLVNDVRELQSAAFRDGGPAPRGVVAPRDFSITSHQAKAGA